jgi:serine/threonine protein kinase
LKPTNIVLNEKGILKILDYGIARDILPENLTPEAGTPFYRAPEIFLGINSYDKKGLLPLRPAEGPFPKINLLVQWTFGPLAAFWPR